MDVCCTTVMYLIKWSSWGACIRLDSNIGRRWSVKVLICLGVLIQDICLPGDVHPRTSFRFEKRHISKSMPE